MDYRLLLSCKRRRPSSVSDRDVAEEMASDRSRIVYSSPFRRLSQKAQVFCLEENAAVRNRITHSVEVADVGRLIAYEVCTELVNQGKLDAALQLPFIYVVENACLLHDIGNPPFGHFGEAAIREWFERNWRVVFLQSAGEAGADRLDRLARDFTEFDGNPQGVRLVLRLQRDFDTFSMNLTYPTILALIKYTRSAAEKSLEGVPLTKKPGYFESEKEVVLDMKQALGLPTGARHPLAYIMEAADDIAFCVSDMEDGIEKGIITENEFFDELVDEWKRARVDGDPDCFPLGDITVREDSALKFLKFKTSYSRAAIIRAAARYLEYNERLLTGEIPSLFPDDTTEGRAIKCLKNVARRKLFRSAEAENPELAGHRIISGILDSYERVLSCSEKDFSALIKSRNDPTAAYGKNLDLEWRLVNKLPRKYVAAYKDLLKEAATIADSPPEWYFRVHLVLDFISGMTDGFAMDFYQLLNGTRLS